MTGVLLFPTFFGGGRKMLEAKACPGAVYHPSGAGAFQRCRCGGGERLRTGLREGDLSLDVAGGPVGLMRR